MSKSIIILHVHRYRPSMHAYDRFCPALYWQEASLYCQLYCLINKYTVIRVEQTVGITVTICMVKLQFKVLGSHNIIIVYCILSDQHIIEFLKQIS